MIVHILYDVILYINLMRGDTLIYFNANALLTCPRSIKMNGAMKTAEKRRPLGSGAIDGSVIYAG